MIQLIHPIPSLATVGVAMAFLAFFSLTTGVVPPPGETLLLVLSLALQQFAISVHNDYCDRAIDAVAKPSRPVPSGAISPRSAFRLATILAGGSLLLAVPLGLDEVTLVAVFMACGFVYNISLKRTAFSWLPFSIAFPLIPLFAAASVDVWPIWWPAVALAAQPLIVAIHLADSIPDIETDGRAGSHGLAYLLGPRLARRVRNAGIAVSLVTIAAITFLSRS